MICKTLSNFPVPARYPQVLTESYDVWQILVVIGVLAVLILVITWLILTLLRQRRALAALAHQQALLKHQLQECASDLTWSRELATQSTTELAESKNRFRSFFELPLVGSAISSPEKEWLEVSAKLCAMLGYSANELASLTWMDVTHPDDLEANLSLFNQVIAGEIDTYTLEKRYLRKDGSVIWTDLSTSCVRKPDRSIQYFVTLVQDITERKRSERVEREQRVWAEALRDTATALNNTLNLDNVLDHILDNVNRVVPHNADSIGIILLDPTRQVARLVRYRNTRGEAPPPEIQNIEFSLQEMRNLREMQNTHTAVIIPDTRRYEGWIANPASDWIRSNLGVPITIKGEILGFLSLASAELGAFSPLDAERMRIFADQAAIAIENARLYAEVQELAVTDALTGVFNRRGLMQLGEREVERALRFNHSLAIIMLDIDFFKQVNDTYGHPMGDRVLHAIATNCVAQVRSLDIVARYGGEEFIILLPESDLPNAFQVAERLRQTMEKISIPLPADTYAPGQTVQVTVSLGVAKLTPETTNLLELMAQVDQALYAAKQTGRNRVVPGK